VLAAWLLPESLPPEQRRRESVAAIVATYVRILRDRSISAGCCRAARLRGLLAYISGSSFVYIELFEVPPERFGLYFGANAIGLMIASQVNRYLAGRVPPQAIVRVGAAVRGGAGAALFVDAYTGFGGFAASSCRSSASSSATASSGRIPRRWR
jgi:DHA1 family bicyclomycin/chloramphenicol resistance-like MFS transporter